MKRTFTGTVEDGRAKFDDYTAALLRQHVGTFEGQLVSFTVGPAESKRSRRAAGYYFGVVLAIIAAETGNDVDALHDYFCDRLVITEKRRVQFWNRITGEQEFAEFDAPRTREMSGEQFYAFVEGARGIAASEWSITTPDPDPDYQADRTKAHQQKYRRAA